MDDLRLTEVALWVSTIGLGALTALGYGFILAVKILRQPKGDAEMIKISDAIQEGANAYLKKQYTVIAVVGAVTAFILEYFAGMHVAGGFLVGATLSGFAGFCGMRVSVCANVRTAQAATQGMRPAFSLALHAGAVTGFLVKGLALIGMLPIMWWLVTHEEGTSAVETLVALGFGASLISIFARLGGGIFTKGADVGADLVGKIESKIPEDDPRNPAVIADNVGDNVGDCAGMAADLFETYVVTLVANVLIGYSMSSGSEACVMYPLLIAGLTSFASIAGIALVRLRGENIMQALYNSLFVTIIVAAILIFFGTHWFTQTEIGLMAVCDEFALKQLLGCAGVGLLLTVTLMWTTEYYTACQYRPVRSIAMASEKGHATNVIQGLAISLEATAIPTLLISASILTAYMVGGIYGVSIAATTMLSLAGMIVTLDAYGPITDNAGGIAEMAKMPTRVRKITDALDAVGNTTKAVTKGYAIGSAALAALVIFSVYVSDLKRYMSNTDIVFSLVDPFVIVGLILGGALPYFFSALSMLSVGRVGGCVVAEVRRQFKENPEILEGKKTPDYGKTVTLLTQSAINEMVAPAILPIFAPVVVFFVINALSSLCTAFVTIGAMILGSTITGLFLALSMTSGGGAWDNAKKYIEDGNYGGKNSAAHAASVTGDTVGDPYKDTAGPAINPMIKIINIVALLLLMAVAR